ncbi:putative nucleotidyltransferase substrate binding domain-containing protein [Rhodococcus sp. NPDC003318]|uniref:putative nucleotidyltransferase substrate binding domain-containing protein n=1 Tax=Rhodococcus sp. NPDC003318 TaxID=3364503 RepID=UPI0036A1D7F5
MNEPLVVRDPAMRPIGELLREPALTCPPETTVAEAARAMTDGRRRCLLIPLPGGSFGILTEGDLRRRVVAAGMDAQVPVAAVMTSPARTAVADTLGADALLDMLTHGVRRLPVLSATGEPLGVIEDADLLANATRGGFLLRAEIARAENSDRLVAATARIPTLAVALSRARVAALDVSAVHSALVESAVSRTVELVDAESPCDAAWLVLGSVARREALPGSDVDSATTWADDTSGESARVRATRVHSLLDRCGLRADDKGALASRPRFARSLADWDAAIDGWLADPYSDQGLVMLSMLLDSRVVGGEPEFDLASSTARALRPRSDALRLLLREAVEDKARMPARRGIVSRRAEPMNVKVHGLSPVVNIARWAGTASGLAAETTPIRLRAAASSGALSEDDARVLAETFDVFTQIRLRNQCEQIERGEPPTDVVDPDRLSPLQRSLLAGAVREVAGVQRTLAYAGPPA